MTSRPTPGSALDLGAPRADPAPCQAASAIGVGFWSVQVDGGRVEWDAQMYRLHGRDPARGPAGPREWIAEHVHPQDRTWLTERLRRDHQRDEPLTVVLFRLPDAGVERWVQSWVRRVRRGDERWLFGMHVEVTGGGQALPGLQHERERTQFAVEAAGIGVWERDASGRIVYWNEAMYRLRGLDPQDPRPFEALATACTPADERERLSGLVTEHLSSGQPYRTELRVQRADGVWRWFASMGQAVRDADGRAIGMVGLHMDITERKQAEALQREKERIEQASRDKSAFMARVSHELRTPLNAVLGFARLIEDDLDEPASPRQRERVRRIADAGHRLLVLVEDMLELSRVESGVPLPAAPSPVPLAALLADVHAEAMPLARDQGVSLAAPVVTGEAVALADRETLRRALKLLVQHALRRSPAGAEVRLRAGREPAAGAPGGRVAIGIADDGPDLTAEQHLWLFESFAPGDRSAEPDDAGALRLSLARGLVLAMDGRLDARPAADGGTEYRIELPAVAAAAPKAADAGVLRVLYVEDNAVNQLLVRELLALRPAVQLLTAEDGASGIARARESSPHVLLLDMQLPDVHGIELMRRLRDLPGLAGSTFVALSADVMAEHVQAALAAGFDAYWTKPIDFDRFLAEIDRLAAAH